MVASTLGPLSVPHGKSDIVGHSWRHHRPADESGANVATHDRGCAHHGAGRRRRHAPPSAERTSAVQLNRRSPPSRQGRRGDLLMAPRAVGHGCRRARRAAWRSEPIAPSRASRTACRRGRPAPSSTVLQRPGGPSHHRRSCRRDLPCIPASERPPGEPSRAVIVPDEHENAAALKPRRGCLVQAECLHPLRHRGGAGRVA